MSDDADCLKIETRDRVRLLTLNRPDRRNAMSRELGNRLRRAVIAADRDPDVYLVAITEIGRAHV